MSKVVVKKNPTEAEKAKPSAAVAKIEKEKELQATGARAIVDVLNSQSESEKLDQYEVVLTVRNKATKASASVTVASPIMAMAHYREDSQVLRLELPVGCVTRFAIKPAP